MPNDPFISTDRPRRRVGLVLGGGGATGLAFHVGTLLALQHDVGWDPNAAAVIVGSSAGSIIGGLLRAGLSTDDLAAWGTSVDAVHTGIASRRTLDQLHDSRPHIAPSVPRVRVLSPGLWRSLLPPRRRQLHTAMLALLPDGWIDTRRHLEQVGQLLGEWPDDPLWMTAVRLPDATRVVFGRDAVAITPGQAVAASCAIPGVFTPVSIAGHRYIDGGAHSPTNADLLLDADIETAVVLSPMSARPGSAGWRPDHLLRRLCQRRLNVECELLARAGIDVHIFEPDESTLRSMGANALDPAKAPVVIRDAFLAAGAQIAASPALGDVLGAQGRVRSATRAPA